MWTHFIVKSNIFLHTFAEVLFQCVFSAIGFLSFECGKESLRHSVILRFSVAEKEYLIPHFCKSFSKVLELYCVPRSLWKVRFCGLSRFSNASLKVTVTRLVLILRDTFHAMTLLDKTYFQHTRFIRRLRDVLCNCRLQTPARFL